MNRPTIPIVMASPRLLWMLLLALAVSCAPQSEPADPDASTPAPETPSEETTPSEAIGGSNRPEDPAVSEPTESEPSPEVEAESPESESSEDAPAEEPEAEELIELSFQGADVNHVTQWIAEKTKKSVIKHPQVNCQLTIINPSKLPVSEALELVYSALLLEGYQAIEQPRSIYLVPKGQAGNLRLEIASDSQDDRRRRVMKVYDLKYAQAGELEDKVENILSEDADVESDRFANKLVVTDYGDRLATLDQLIESLDMPRSGEVDLRVIRISNVDAEDLADEIEPIYEEMNDQFNEDIEIVANSRSNSLVILSSQDSYEILQRLVQNLDVADAVASVMDTFLLTNADSEEVAEQLTTLFQNGDSRSRSSYYYYRSRGNDDAQINFVANRRQNSVIVQAPPAKFPEIEKLIRSLDAPLSDAGLAPRIIKLRYVSAFDIETVLNELFTDQNQTRDYFFWDDRGGRDDGGVGRLAGKVKITSEPYSNSIIVTSNSAENLDAVFEVVRQLDTPTQAGETTLRVPLNFANAIKVANQLNILFATSGAPPIQQQNSQQGGQNNPNNQQGAGQDEAFQQGFVLQREQEDSVYYPWLGGQPQGGGGGRFGSTTTVTRPVSDLVGRVRIVPDKRTNSLIVTANMNYFPEVVKMVNELDLPTPQVVIQAKIIEVSSDLRDRLGVRWSPDGAQVFEQDDYDNSILGSGTGDYRDVVTGSELANALTTGVLSADINLDVLVQFLKKNADAKILANPQINVEDNELGRLFVGAKVPFISNATFSTQTGGRNDSFDYRDVGIILEVTPNINNDHRVALKVRVESSAIRDGQTLFGGFILDTRNFQTDLAAQDGETLVLGGIIQNENREIVRKVPILGNIPGMGWAFKKRDTITRDVELMVFLQPRVTRSPEDVQRLMEQIGREIPNITRWNRDLESTLAPPTHFVPLEENEPEPHPEPSLTDVTPPVETPDRAAVDVISEPIDASADAPPAPVPSVTAPPVDLPDAPAIPPSLSEESDLETSLREALDGRDSTE